LTLALQRLYIEVGGYTNMADKTARIPTQVRMNEAEKKRFTKAAELEGRALTGEPMGLGTWLRYLADKRIREMDALKSKAA
jgi:hypothetical protein